MNIIVPLKRKSHHIAQLQYPCILHSPFQRRQWQVNIIQEHCEVMFLSKIVRIHQHVLFAVRILQGWKIVISHINLATWIKPFPYCAIQVRLGNSVAF
jgi:hypothetical protein